ncbi:hypothetical protein [Mesorhizobium sp. WSM4904]|uniref:hypothetical protein n=1 Tax=Mesorhizobium sp. WSM4904 TaxID=3038545 RepID=UPI002418AE56|nr:hypothetical protein [Mesorhizobium sp. WSM4904]WFP61243.1 hypothetical protein QAZ47_22470 [Mesorhizobium sp. WSM4904]
MHIEVNGTALIRALTTGNEREIEADELAWEEHIEERAMGAEATYAARFDFEDGHVAWEVTEYPVGAFNSKHTHEVRVKLVRDFQISLVHDEDD